jgi:hypothetical protein
MLTLGTLFGGVALSTMGGSKAKATQTPPINASSKEESDFIQYVTPHQDWDMLDRRSRSIGTSWHRRTRMRRKRRSIRQAGWKEGTGAKKTTCTYTKIKTSMNLRHMSYSLPTQCNAIQMLGLLNRAPRFILLRTT